ncbi:LruC domain-containing protein [Leptospira inadai]|nr:LruC domain-containing protein [Leptospira inadai]
MKKIVLLALLAGLILNCNNGKKKGLLLPFLSLLNTQNGAATGATGSAGIAGNSGSTGVVFTPGDGFGNPVSQPGSGSSPTSSAGTTGSSSSSTPSTSSGTGATNSGNPSGGSSSDGSGSTPPSSQSSSNGNGSSSSNTGTSDNSSSNGNSGNHSSNGGSENNSGSANNHSNNPSSDDRSGNNGGSTNTSGSGNSGGDKGSGTPTVAVVVVDDPKGSSHFNFNTTQTIPLNLTVVDKETKPVSGATVLVYDETSNLLFQGISDSSGKVSGSLTVPTSVGSITIDISIGGESISQYVNLEQRLGITRTIRYAITLPSHKVADSDGDGVPDNTDIYPDDRSRSTELLYPAEGVYTLAFEDLYPSPGDADLNDYVVQFRNEEDLDATGKIVRLRGKYQHVARGAGYTHKLLLKLPVNVGATVTYKRTDGNENNKLAHTTATLTAAQLNQGYELLPDSGKTLHGQNANPGEVFKQGHVATIEIIFDSPVTRAQLGAFPYDLFAHVVNSKQDIHFPGLYKNADGSDRYMDSTGFPWAILVPGAWKYPYEKQDIRKASQTGYGDFSRWVESKGTNYKAWYNHITNESKVFPVPDSPNFLGYLFLSVKKFAAFYAIALLGIGGIGLYILRRKQSIVI